jgi:hypothetical protein
MPVEAIYQLAEHYGAGAEKYGDRNWAKGYPYGLSFAALNRHLWKWWGGEDIDEETGSHHLIAVAWHALALIEFSKTHPEMDDRPKDKYETQG